MVWPSITESKSDKDNEERVSEIKGMKKELATFAKRDQWFRQNFIDRTPQKWTMAPYKASEFIFDYSAHLLGVPEGLSPLEKVEHASISMGHDALWAYMIGGKAFSTIKSLGSVGQRGSTLLESQIKQLKDARKPGEGPSQKELVLYEGLGFYELLKLPNLFLKGTKKLTIDSYYYLKSHAKPISTDHFPPHMRMPKIFDQVIPASDSKTLKNFSDYFHQTMNTSRSREAQSSNFLDNPVIHNALQQCKLDHKLTTDQAHLLSLYVYSHSADSSRQSFTATKPDSVALKKSLETLHQGLIEDLSKPNPEHSKVYQLVKQSTDHSEHLLANLREERDVRRRQTVHLESIHQSQLGVSAATNLGSQIAMLSGQPRFASKINAIGSGVNHWLSSAASFATGNPVMGLLSVGSAVCSLFSGLFGDDDDDNGLQEISNQINELHQHMSQGFDAVLTQQISLAKGLSEQMTYGHQANMTRFDYVDAQLNVVQQQLVQGYQQLTRQQVQISQQVTHLSQQLSETERNIVRGLQLAHSDITNKLQLLNQNLLEGVTRIDQRLQTGFLHLNQELYVQIAEQKLFEQHCFRGIATNQSEQQLLLHHQAQQLHLLHKMQLRTKQDAILNRNKKMFTKACRYAQELLQEELPTHSVNALELEKALRASLQPAFSNSESQLTADSILCALDSKGINQPHDIIHLIQNHACAKLFSAEQKQLFTESLPYFPAWQKNLLAYLKWAITQENAPIEKIEQLKTYAKQTRNLLHFCHALANPQTIKQQLEHVAQALEALGQSIERTFAEEEANVLANLQQRLVEQATHYKNQTHSLTSSGNDLQLRYNDTLQHINQMQLQLMGNNPHILFTPAVMHYVHPASDETTRLALPLVATQCPPIPELLITLEALGEGKIEFTYSYDALSHQLSIDVAFIFREGGRKLGLGRQSLPAENEAAIPEVWRHFVWTNVAVSLSVEDQNEIRGLYDSVLKKMRLNIHQKLTEKMINHPQIEVIKAHVALLHSHYHLLFGMQCQEQHNIVQVIFAACFKNEQWQQALNNYEGGELHPYHDLLQSTSFYQELAQNLNQALENRSLYIENLEIENLIILLETMVLEWLPEAAIPAYLDTVVNELPIPARAVPYFIRGTWNEFQGNRNAAIEDYTQALQLRPDDNQIRGKLARVLYEQGNWEETITHCNLMLETIDQGIQSTALVPLKQNLYLNHILVLTLRANAYFSSQLYSAAFTDYEEACVLGHEHPELLFGCGLSAEKLGEYALAIPHFQKIISSDPEQDQSRFHLALCLFTDNRLHDALEHYEKLIQKYPKSIELKLKGAECTPNQSQALNWLAEIAEDSEANIDQLLKCSELFLHKNDLAGARIACERIKKMSPNPAQIQYNSDISVRIAAKSCGHHVYVPKFVLTQGIFKVRNTTQVNAPEPSNPLGPLSINIAENL